MSFAGVSVVADGKLLKPSVASAVYSSTASGGGGWYHLLVVKGYSRFKKTPNGACVHGLPFKAGGYRWLLRFYPKGSSLEDAGFASVFLHLDQDDGAEPIKEPVKVRIQFSLVDELDKQNPTRIRAIKPSDFTTESSTWGDHRFRKLEDLDKSHRDYFIIRCDFIIAESAAAPVIEVPPSNICQQLNHLFATKVGVDVKFEVGRETFVAHRCVLAARSTVFMAELFGSMKEGTTTSTIHIQDMDPNVFKALLGFIYTDSMPTMEVEEGGAEVNWLRHLLAAADIYDLQRLKSMCEERLLKHIDVSSVMAILDVAAQHHCHILKEACLEFLKAQSATDLRGVLATIDWERIAVTNLSVVNDFIVKLASKV